MKCIKCEKEIAEGSTFCELCGAKQVETTATAVPEATTTEQPEIKIESVMSEVDEGPVKKKKQQGTFKQYVWTGMITGILSFFILPYVFGVMAILFGVSGLRLRKEQEVKDNITLPIVSIFLGSAGIILKIIQQILFPIV